MRTAAGADDFRPDHPIARVADVPQVTFGEGLGEARPSGSAFELGSTVKQRQATQPAGENARPLFIQEHAAKGRFGAVLQQDMLLFIVEVGH